MNSGSVTSANALKNKLVVIIYSDTITTSFTATYQITILLVER